MVREGKLGTLRSVIATNTQNQGDPSQWRLKRSLAGGGCLPDVDIYCLNAARFLSNEEPTEVTGVTFQPKMIRDSARSKRLQLHAALSQRTSRHMQHGYARHPSQFLRLEGSEGWAELNPAFRYTGLKLRTSRLMDAHETTREINIEAKDQFAEEMGPLGPLRPAEHHSPHAVRRGSPGPTPHRGHLRIRPHRQGNAALMPARSPVSSEG